LQGGREKICAVIGDGSMTGGMAYEALNQAAHLKSGCVIVLNDNEMSIGKNVGGLSKTLNRIRVGSAYNDLKSNVENTLMNIPDVGYKMAKGIKKSKDSLKNLLVPGMFFEEMGITYVGPIDGHNIPEMVKTFQDAFQLNRPIVVHVKTKKGKGYRYAEKYPEHFHGVEPFDLDTGKAIKPKRKATNTDVFARKLLALGKKEEKLVAITAAMAEGTGVSLFQKQFPKRTFDVGIAEQHAVTFGAGLAKAGYVPVVAIYSSFLQRAYDQILHDVCLQKLHVIFAVDRSGLVGADGETHQGIYDTGFLTQMPNMTVIAPKNDKELAKAMDYAMELDGPVAIKYSRGEAYSGCSDRLAEFEQGRSELISDGSRVAIIACGNMMETAVQAGERLASQTGITPAVINARFLKPMDEDMLRYYGRQCEVVAILEEQTEAGSYGEKAASVLLRTGCKARLLPFCIHAESVRHGDVASLRRELGLDVDSIVSGIEEALQHK
jgi:1-deoxy-D-xylulose-5-phosphate synthase